MLSSLPCRVLAERRSTGKRTFKESDRGNGELEAIGQTLRLHPRRMKHADGLRCWITFHSLEDRIVKETFAEMARANLPSTLRCVSAGIIRKCGW